MLIMNCAQVVMIEISRLFIVEDRCDNRKKLKRRRVQNPSAKLSADQEDLEILSLNKIEL